MEGRGGCPAQHGLMVVLLRHSLGCCRGGVRAGAADRQAGGGEEEGRVGPCRVRGGRAAAGQGVRGLSRGLSRPVRGRGGREGGQGAAASRPEGQGLRERAGPLVAEQGRWTAVGVQAGVCSGESGQKIGQGQEGVWGIAIPSLLNRWFRGSAPVCICRWCYRVVVRPSQSLLFV